MLILGSSVAVIGFFLLWYKPYTGLLAMVVGFGLIWSQEDHKIKKRNEKKLYEEESEREFNRLKFEEPVSPKLFELSTLLFGTIKPHEAWLLEQLDQLEHMYSNDPMATIEETQDFSTGKFKSLFSTGSKYQDIVLFLNRDISTEIFEDIEKLVEKSQTLVSNEITLAKEEEAPNLNDILADYDLEEWAKIRIIDQIAANNDRNTILKNVVIQAKKELNKNISISCLHDEWIINGRIRFKI